jgi:hypothetical protein
MRPLPLAFACLAAFAIQDRELKGNFRWKASRPLLSVVAENLPPSPDNPWFSVKDPSVVRHDGRWHLFCTLRKTRGGDGKPPGYIRIGALSFADWKDAPSARWNLLDLTIEYHGAPQVFWFEPKKRWFLVYQCEDSTRGIEYGPCYSTTEDISKPETWSRPAAIFPKKFDGVPTGLDFWVICDAAKAYLFYTDLRGGMWRAETKIEDFPQGFGKPVLALQGDIFEASHTYRLKGLDQYLTIVEAQGGPARYYKAFVADKLDGEWRPLASTPKKPFAHESNVRHDGKPWTQAYSHGELIRTGIDQTLEVDPAKLQFLFQGATEPGRWQLGLLEPD